MTHAFIKKQKFRIWATDWEDEDDGEVVESYSAFSAAGEYAERNYPDWEYPERIELTTVSEDGEREEFVVTVEMEPAFTTHRKKKHGNEET